MADEVGAASSYFELEAAALSRRGKPKGLPPKGVCYYCDEPVADGKVFCDASCAEDHEWVASRAKQNGA